jgi:hypothetical protein
VRVGRSRPERRELPDAGDEGFIKPWAPAWRDCDRLPYATSVSPARSISMIRNLEMHDPVSPPALLWREDQKRNFISLIDSFWSKKTILIKID